MQKSSKRTSISLTISNHLPPNFAEQVMDLELEVEVNPKIDIEKVNRLVELYSAAVEYYESIKSNNFIVFKNKIVKLMMNPSLDRSQKQVKLSHVRSTGNLHTKQKISQNKRQQLQQTLQVSSSSSNLHARRMMLGADTKSQKVAKKIGNEISKQESKIQQRLKMRKGKVQIISIGSTESDPKQKQSHQNNDIFCFQTILQSNDVVQQESNKQKSIKQVEIKQTQIKNMFSKQIDIKPHPKKQVLTLQPNQKQSQLPSEYIIPF